MVDFQSRTTRRDGEAGGSGSGAPEPKADGPNSVETSTESDTADDVLGFAVVTVGSERSIDDDAAGDAVLTAVEDVGDVVTREVIDDRYDGVQSTVGSLAERGDVDVLVTVGGTGPEPRDVTVDAVAPLLEKRLPGIGELIRRQCAERHGTAAIRIRAMGGTLDGVPVFCLPGSPAMAEAAATEVVVPEAGSLADLAAIPDTEE